MKRYRQIHPYGSKPIVARSCVTCDVRIGDRSARTEFVVIAGDSPPLLGKATAELLGALHVGVNAVQCSQADIIAQYPGIEKGIGTLKNVVVTLHIDKSVTPVARKQSRVSFHLRDKAAAEIDKLIRADIIEKVTGPTEWVSRIVTPPKPKKPEEIRLCVDIRKANKAILRTRHVTPTIDELVSGLRGATVFSVCSAVWNCCSILSVHTIVS